MAAITQQLFAVDIARMRGVTERSAQRWLSRMECRHGAAVVSRDGQRRFTTLPALAKAMPAFAVERSEAESDVDEIRDVVYRLVGRIRDLESDVSRLKATLANTNKLGVIASGLPSLDTQARAHKAPT